MSKNDNLHDFLQDIANAIREKKGTSEPINAQKFSEEITSITAGSGSEQSGNSVIFRDYDGSILHSYSKDAFLSLDSLPDLPTRRGLICQGWNYSLSDAQSYVEEYGVLEVGATYITDDGKTRLYIRITDKGRMKVPLYFSQTHSHGVTIDWGDGSDAQILSGAGNKNTTHTYSSVGDYIISLSVIDGCTLGLTANDSSYCVMGSIGNYGKVYCNMLQAVEIGKGVTNIGTYAFACCSSLSSISIPNSVTSIGSRAFEYCYSLLNISIPSGVTSIGDNTFYHCHCLSSIAIPSDVISIGTYAFGYCYSLSNIIVSRNVTKIASNIFSYCYALSSLVIPSNITSIGSSAFGYCRSLSSIVIPSNVTSIGTYAFQYCESLSSIVIPTGVTKIDTHTFYYCYSLSNVVIPSSVTSIGTYAFAYCNSLSNISIPSSVTTIDTYAFDYCFSLSNIVIPSGVTSIGTYTFGYCYCFSNVVIPSSVTTIGTYAFAYCYGCAYYDFRASTSVPTLPYTTAFNGIPSDCKIVVPDALYDEWIAATNWSSYASKIIKASEFNG